MAHSLQRTSPKGKGQPFIGTCLKCGIPNIPIERMGEECVNPAGLNSDETLILALGLHRPAAPPAQDQKGEANGL